MTNLTTLHPGLHHYDGAWFLSEVTAMLRQEVSYVSHRYVSPMLQKKKKKKTSRTSKLLFAILFE
jgi:hypothetical protein